MYVSVIHRIKKKHLSVVWNWYHFVAIANLHQPRPTDSADINTRLQFSDTSSIPPMHGSFLLLSRDWAAPDHDTALSYPVIRRSKFSVSPACHNRITWLATSAKQLTLLAVVRSKQLCQAPRPWRHNATPWRRHIQNITVFRNKRRQIHG